MPIRNRQKHPREHPYPYHESMREFLTRIVLINQQSIDSGGDDDPSRSVNEFRRRPCCRREIAFYCPWILIGFSTERLLIIFIQLQMSAWIMVYTVTSLFLWKDPYHTSEQGLFQNFCCITKYHTGVSVLRAILNKLAIAVKHRFH